MNSALMPPSQEQGVLHLTCFLFHCEHKFKNYRHNKTCITLHLQS